MPLITSDKLSVKALSGVFARVLKANAFRKTKALL